MINAHLEGYQPGGVIYVLCGKRFGEIIALSFRIFQRHGC